MSAARELLRTAVRDTRGAIVPGTLLLCGYQAAEASVPIVLGLITDRVLTSTSGWALAAGVGALALVIAGVSFCWQNAYFLVQRGEARWVHQRRQRASAAALAPRAAEADAGESVTIIGEDIHQAATIIDIVPKTVASIVGVLVCATALTVVDPVLGAIVLGSVGALLALLHLLSRHIAHTGQEHQRLVAEATARVSDLLAGLRPLDGIGGQAAAYGGYVELSTRARRRSERLALLSGAYAGLAGGANTLLLGVVGVIAGLRAFDGEISVGELVMVIGLTQFIGEPLGMATRMPRYAALAVASARRVVTLGEAPSATTGSPVPHAGDTPAVTVGRGPEAWEAPDGLLTAVVCEPDEADRIAAGLRTANPVGTLLVRGVAVDRLDLEQLRTTVLADARQPAIFTGTVVSNVAPGGRFAPRPDDPLQALRRAQASELVHGARDAPAGHNIIDRPVIDRGLDLSGGQRQRLALARALHADPEILVLVDPDSAVDAATGSALASAIAEARRGRTTLVLAASPAFCAVADVTVHSTPPAD